MSAPLAVVLVHYRAAESACRAVERLRADLHREGISAEWILVDNGSDADARARLASLDGVRLVVPGRNLGYAGGVGAGMTRCRAERVLVANPDVLVRPGCCRLLLEALDSGAAAVGPRFFWDDGCRVLLPPTERRTRLSELATSLAARGPRWARLARALWRRHARRHWDATSPLPSESLSGALMLFRRSAWEAVGPFDPVFPLYFEESDWLRRLARHGLSSLYVPAAEVIHHWARSSIHEPRAEEWFARSAGIFRQRHYGAAWSRLLARLERGGGEPPPPGEHPTRFGLPGGRDLKGFWVEISPTPRGLPAGAERLEDGPAFWTPPPEAWERLPPGRYPVRLVSPSGRELAEASLVRSADA